MSFTLARAMRWIHERFRPLLVRLNLAPGRILYKYLPANRTMVLDNKRIRFTQANAFNDPFESAPHFDSLLETQLVDDIVQPHEDHDPAEHARFRAQLLEALSNPESRQWKIDNTVSRLGILCLSNRRDGVLMWSHYADSHRGFVVGFDAQHDSIRNRKDGSRHLLRVKYTMRRPRAETLDQFSIEQLFGAKSKEWLYENEWRLIDATSNADATDDKNGETILLFAFDAAAVREVILGARMRDDTRNTIQGILSRPEYSHVKILQAELHRSEYRVEIRGLD